MGRYVKSLGIPFYDCGGSRKVAQMPEKAERHNEGKPRLTFNLLGREVAELEARVWEYGADKYAPGQWLKGLPLTEALDSLIRHATAVLNGEDTDPESGLPHVGFLITNGKMIANTYLTRPDLDDRPKAGDS